MGNIVQTLAFIPPDRPEAHAQMEIENETQLQRVKNSLGHKVALLWFDFNADLTILYSHGNAEDLAGSKSTFVDLANSLGVNICAYDYSGYGLSEGTCSEKACFADINAVYDFLVNEKKKKPSEIIVFGRSLGTGPTIHLASEHPDLAGMILQSPLRTAIKTQMPDWVGFVFNKIDIFRNEEKVKKIQNYPVFIIHGTEDKVVPYEHGKVLHGLLQKANSNSERVEIYSVEGCGHNDIEYRKGREFKRKLNAFINQRIRKQQKNSMDQESKMDYNENDKNENYIDENGNRCERVKSISTDNGSYQPQPKKSLDELFNNKEKRESLSVSDKIKKYDSLDKDAKNQQNQ